MDELTNAIAQKTGLSQDQAKAAGQAAVDFMMTKLPGPLGEQVKAAMGGGGGAAFGDAAKGLGGMLGKK